MNSPAAREVLAAVRAAARTAEAPWVLAVSGGLDSMALLYAASEVARSRIAAVATFDHGTGTAATAAAAHVSRSAAALRLPVVTGHIGAPPDSGDGCEAAWRSARYTFLKSVAEPMGAQVVTAHTEDDQVETVLMRVLRGSGARGLAGLYGVSEIVRPFVGVRRGSLRAFAAERTIIWREDPGNASRAHLRNRVRLDLLPALRAVRPVIEDELLTVARHAAEWRATMDDVVSAAIRPSFGADGTLRIAAPELASYDEDCLRVIWGALAARVGLALDRRGTRRLATFTMRRPRVGAMPLSGGWYMEVRRGVYILGKRSRQPEAPTRLPGRGTLEWGAFRFRAEEQLTTAASPEEEPWRASLDVVAPAMVRAWADGDRLARSGGHDERRVKRYLSDAGVRGLERVGWPVVVDETGNVVWIPGVRRADAATERSGRPVRHYVCERITR